MTVSTYFHRPNSGTKRKMSIETRFFFTLFILLLTVLLLVSLFLSLTGVFSMNGNRINALFQHELRSISDRIESDFSTVSSHSVNLSSELSLELEAQLKSSGVSPASLSQHPELLNTLLDALYPILAGECKAVNCSGTYVVLDATVNPSLSYANTSRSCIFLKNISVQNNSHTSRQDIRYLYGPLDIGRNHELTFLPQWNLELDTTAVKFYQSTIENARLNPDLTLSRLMYWCPLSSDGASDQSMFCTVPLIASDGTVMGACGFEISSMQFKLNYLPKVSGQDYLFCLMAPSNKKQIDFSRSLFAGNYAVATERPSCSIAREKDSSFHLYSCRDAGDFYGINTTFSLYPNASLYHNQNYSVALLAPSSAIRDINRKANVRSIGTLFLLFLIGTGLSVALCRRNIRPMKEALTALRQSKNAPASTTNIKEIDDLFDFLSKKDQAYEEKLLLLEQERAAALRQSVKARATADKLQAQQDAAILDSEEIHDFLLHLNELTSKEREVFDLYLHGYKAKDISNQLGITMNTLKYHNKNIYTKLGVSSRSELLIFAQHIPA